VTKKTQIT